MWQFGRGQGEGTGGGSSQLAPMTTDLTHGASRRQASEPTLPVYPENHLITALDLNAWAEVLATESTTYQRKHSSRFLKTRKGRGLKIF